jgi:uncharacterized SAM-binding protein YcdF (DUF218 family)
MSRACKAVCWSVAIFCVAGAALVAARPELLGQFLVKQDRLEVADAVLVFSGDPGYERTLEAVRLYHGGYARYLVFSGHGGPGDSAESMAAVAVDHGVPATALLREDQATNTYENVLFVRGLLARHHVHRLILVTSPYHQRRAYLVALHLLPGIRLINHPASSVYWRPQGWWRSPASRLIVYDEYTKIIGYVLFGRI